MNRPKTERKRACATFVKWSQQVEDGDVEYTVHLVTPWDPRLVRDFGYACNCKEFRTQTGACVHILMAKGHHCGWHEAFDEESLEDPVQCPRCAGATVEVRYTP